MKRVFTLLIGLALSCGMSFGQINDGGSTPVSWGTSLTQTNQLPVVQMPALDIEQVTKEDDEKAAKDGTFMRTGRLIEMGINIENDGIWEYLPNGDRIWRTYIQSVDALAMNLYFDRFYLPGGAKLHVYSPDHKQVIGGFTNFNNQASGLFATELIDGDALIVEYYEPAHQIGRGEIVIGQVGHTYRSGGFGSSDNCQVNVNCSPEGDNKTEQRDAVARILVTVQAGQGWCSGSMINNADQDCTPYFLTAMHCGLDGGNLTTAANINQWIFYFNYQSAGCASGSKPTPNTITGATTVSHSDDGGGNSGSDFLLLLLNNQPQTAWNVFYAGWNRSTAASGSGYGIHHPSGDIKKISTYTSALQSTQWGSAAGSHWLVTWSATANGHGVTEGGSSGSPIFNANGEIVGTLTGGSSFCTATGSPDLYGKFDYSWDQNGGANNRQLAPWLDPNGTGLTSMPGVYHPCNVATINDDAGISAVTNPPDGIEICGDPITPEVTIYNYGTNNLTSATINYQIDNGPVNTFNWTGSLATNVSEVVTLPNVTIGTTGTPFTFTAYTTNPNGNSDNNNTNDTTAVLSQIAATQALPYAEDFEAGAIPADIFIFDQDNDGFAWAHTTAASAYGTGTGSMFYDNFGGTGASNPGGTFDWAILPMFDLSTASNTELTFDYAYARYSAANADTLYIAVDDNCDGQYNLLATIGTPTAADITTAYTPAAGEWANEVVDMSAFDGMPNVSVAFINASGWGNNMYVDNINITTTVTCNMTASITSSNNVNCNTGSNGSATVSAANGTAPFTYAWSDGQTTQTASNLSAGTYTVTVTDAAGCTATATATITEPSAISITISGVNDESCFGAADGGFTVNATGGNGGFSYDSGSGSQGSNVFTNVSAGTYTITVTDAVGCIGTSSVTINSPTQITATSSSVDASCGASNGSGTVNASGGSAPYTYSWAPGGQTTATATNLSAGSYTVTITDANGCSINEVVNINNTGAPTVTATGTDVTCNGGTDGTATASASGGSAPYTYAWSPGGQTTATAANLSAGVYTVTVTDAAGCVSNATITINEPTAIMGNTSTTDATCGNSDGTATVTVTGGTPPYTYLWNNGVTSATATNLAAGSYTCDIVDANNCSITVSATVNDAAGPVVTISASADISCAGLTDGTATASVSGGASPYTYLWDDGQTSAIATNLPAGSYDVTVTDANGCTANASVTITEPSPINIAVVSATPPTTNSSNDGSIDVTVSGGTPGYAYSWTTGATTEDVTNLGVGSHTLTVTDANQCNADTTISFDPVGIAEEASNIHLLIVPNPGTGLFTLQMELEQTEDAEVAVYNAVGQLIYTTFTNVKKANVPLDLTQEANGVYFVTVKTASSMNTQRLQKVQ